MRPQPSSPVPRPPATVPAAAEAVPKPATSKLKHAGGVDPQHDWEGAADHVTAWVVNDEKTRRPLPRHKNGAPNKTRAIELMKHWFEEVRGEKPPTRESFFRWLKDNPHPEWWGD
jgi:hypothetical protein